MTDYRLDGLSTRTFEHLVQALALDAISTTVTPFGDGPDGGREATFSGQTAYGPPSKPWHGYGVIQAKFLQRPRSSQFDGQWVVRELTKELKRHERRRRKLNSIDYYILATNVTLTPTDQTGSKDAVIKLLDDFVERNGLRGHDVWDYDKFRILIDSNSSVRQAYAAWITPGDVLMQLSEWLKDCRHDYHRLVINYLQKELLSDQYAKLEQAGHTADEAIPLAQVFVDLPIANRPYTSADSGRSSPRGEDLPNFVSFLIDQAAERLVQDSPSDELDLVGRPQRGRYVLIGGPGQGKTTLGQYVCQIFRSSLLQDVPRNTLDPEVRRVIDTFNAKSASGDLQRPGARRLPLRIVLSDFAAALAAKKTSTLVTYLAEGFSRRTNSTLTAQQFEALITRYPSLLVLDGLDEVPASSNREQVLAAVQDFSIDVASCSMDMLILATSRPQDYNEDFSSRSYDHRWLVPLPTEKALEYGTKLAEVRFAGDIDRIAKIVGRLRRAAKASATARIMRSPLQVTILTLLVDRRGQLPQERWALFDEYYNLIYQRETERDIPAAVILREKKDDIDAVHRLVGLLLQLQSEKSGSTDARLTTTQFSRVVEEYLASEGHEGKALGGLRDAIIEGAATRLVFLVGLESGEVGFEIRSLQEFMAAEGLLDADDGLVQSRLRAVANNSNWRNVTLFAAGKVFAKRRYLRDTIEAICVELNDDTSDRASQLVYAGSELALDLLEDGPVARQPAKSRSLTRLALRLLELDGSNWPRRLAAIYQEAMCDIFQEELTRALNGSRTVAKRNAWICLTILIESGIEKLAHIAEAALPSSPPDGLAAVEMVARIEGASDRLAQVLIRTIPSLDPAELRFAAYRVPSIDVPRRLRRPRLPSVGPTNPAREWISCLLAAHDFKSIRLLDASTSRSLGEATIIPIKTSKRCRSIGPMELPSNSHPNWNVTRAAVEFADSPNASNLATVLELMASTSVSDHFMLLADRNPWPLEECLMIGYHDDADLLSVAEAAKAGLLGDRPEWEQWENQWLAEGLSLSELSSDLSTVIRSHVPSRWFPLRAAGVIFNNMRWTDTTFEDLLRNGNKRVRHKLASAFAASFRVRRYGQQSLNPSGALADALLEVAGSRSWSVIDGVMAQTRWRPPMTEAWVRAFARGGLQTVPFNAYMPHGPLAEWLVKAAREFPKQYGLLVCIAYFIHAELSSEHLNEISTMPLDGQPASVRLSRALIMLRAGRPLVDVSGDVAAAFADDRLEVDILVDALASEDRSVNYQLDELLELRKLVICVPDGESAVLSGLRASLRRRQSSLIDERRWVELGFMRSLRDVVIPPIHG